MSVEKLSFVLPADDLNAAVAFWKELLGMEPTFVDGDRWAQFDHGGVRLALGGTDRLSDSPAVMLKISGLDAARDTLRASGYAVSEITTGAHERRCVAMGPGGSPAVLYEPLPK